MKPLPLPVLATAFVTGESQTRWRPDLCQGPLTTRPECNFGGAPTSISANFDQRELRSARKRRVMPICFVSLPWANPVLTLAVPLAACCGMTSCARPAQRGDAPPAASSSRLPSVVLSAGDQGQSAFVSYHLRLSEAGDRGECAAETERVRAAMASDPRISDADLRAEIDHFESVRVKGPMPYPSRGTACSLWGFQKAARAALKDRQGE